MGLGATLQERAAFTAMRHQNLLDRTRAFAVDVLRHSETLPRTDAVTVVRRQLLRSATSVAANYRAACRARSRAEFIARLGIVEEEADEIVFWIDLLASLAVGDATWDRLQQEASSLVAIAVTSRKTARANAGRKEAIKPDAAALDTRHSPPVTS